jgi:hypothetical protein
MKVKLFCKYDPEDVETITNDWLTIMEGSIKIISTQITHHTPNSNGKVLIMILYEDKTTLEKEVEKIKQEIK